MTWFYEGKEITAIPDEYAGFVYTITNNLNGRIYLGQKVSKNKITRSPLKGKTRKRISYSESNWNDYYGSSELLLQDIANYGKEHFRREIIHLCKSKGEMNYRETEEIFARKALLSNDYYNNFVGCKIHGNHIKDLWI